MPFVNGGCEIEVEHVSVAPTANAAPISVFISYSREDRARVLPLIKTLEVQGFNVWWDGLLEGGTSFAKTTETALETSDAIVVLWTERSVQSHWVRDEATRGRDRGCMVPVSLDGTVPPLGFRQIQFIDLSRWKGKPADPDFVELSRAIRRVAGSPDAQIGYTVPAATPSFRPSRRAVVLGGSALAVLGGGLLAWQSGMSAGEKTANRIAVLPFTNLSRDPDQAYFSDGLTSEIRTVLARNPMLQIVGQVSSNAFRDRKGDAKSITEALNVAFLLDGNVQKAGDRVKITTTLTDGRSGVSKWAESFERPLADIFAVQAEIAAEVASAMVATIGVGKPGNHEAEAGGTRNVAAFDAYLHGKGLFDLHIDEVSERAALAQFEDAIRFDPRYAAARAARSRSLGVIANQYETSAKRVRLIDEAVAEAKRATDIAPRYSAGHNALGYALFYGRLDVKGARAPFERAYALATSDIDVLSRYAIFCARTGRFAEASLAMDRAKSLDPLNASVFRTLGSIKFAERQYGAAIAAGEQAIKINPNRNSVNGDIGDSYLILGQLDKARAAYGREKNSLITLTGLAIIEHREGNGAKARSDLEQLAAEHGDNALYQKAQVLAQWGDADAAFATLAEARRLRDSGMVYLLNDPFLDPIRKDPRFNVLLSQAGFL